MKRVPRRFLEIATLSVAIFGLAASPALAGTLDQSQTSGSDGAWGIGSGADLITGQIGTFHQGQAFTAGPSGALDQADLYLVRNCASPGVLTVQIRTVSGDPALPTSTVLASASVPAASVPTGTPAWVTVPFAVPVPVSAGTRYALVATSGGTCQSSPTLFVPGYYWWFANQDPYAGGTLVSSSDAGGSWSSQGGSDFAFKTYVVPDNAPTASAGPDQTVNGGAPVTLDGTGSSDPDGEALTYAWTTTDTGVTLSDPSSPMPTFTAPEVSADRPITFALEVCDGPNPDSLCDTDTVMVNLKAPPGGDTSSGSSATTGTSTTTGTDTGTTNPGCQALRTKLKKAKTRGAKRKVLRKLRALGC
jgi:K319L-like, PKD domain